MSLGRAICTVGARSATWRGRGHILKPTRRGERRNEVAAPKVAEAQGGASTENRDPKKRQVVRRMLALCPNASPG